MPAHINRGSNGLLVNLGMMPQEPAFPVVEASGDLPIDPAVLEGRLTLRSSDAHRLGSILEPVFDLPVDRFSLGGLFERVRGDERQ